MCHCIAHLERSRYTAKERFQKLKFALDEKTFQIEVGRLMGLDDALQVLYMSQGLDLQGNPIPKEKQ